MLLLLGISMLNKSIIGCWYHVTLKGSSYHLTTDVATLTYHGNEIAYAVTTEWMCGIVQKMEEQ